MGSGGGVQYLFFFLLCCKQAYQLSGGLTLVLDINLFAYQRCRERIQLHERMVLRPYDLDHGDGGSTHKRVGILGLL
jgi:hypothetical protein